MSAGLKNMKDHVKAVSNIKKITHSMKVVAAAKYAKAEKTLRMARPLGMGAVHFYLFSNIHKELMAPHHTFLAVTSDRGLCGSMHSRVCRKVKYQILDLKHTHDIVCIGEKAKGILQFDLSRSISLVVNGIGHRTPTFVDASKIVTRTFERDSFMQANIIYPKYKNMASFDVEKSIVYSLPILLSAPTLLKYEYDDDLKSFLEFSQCAIMYYALCEAFRVELSARIMAMSSASKNASAMVSKLQLEYNRKRQQMITNELIDIVSGAQVIVKK